MAYFLGDTTAKDEGRLSPNPLVHLDPMMSVLVPLLLFMTGGVIFGGAKPVPINTRNLKGGAWGMALVGFAGPLLNVILAFVSFLIGHFTGLMYESGVVALIFQYMVTANLGFFAFNMIPIPPLDGSRILYAIAPDGVRGLMEKMERTTGIFIVLLLVMFFGTALAQVTSTVVMAIWKFFYLIVGIQL